MKFNVMALLLILIILSSSCAFSVDNSSNKNNNSMNNKNLTGNIKNTTKLENDTCIYVNPSSGNDENDGLTRDKPKKHIRNAVEKSVENGIICLAEGTYSEYKKDSVSWHWAENPEGNATGSIVINKNITMIGKGAIIDGDFLSISPGKTVFIYGITFENCPNSVISIESANLTIKNCIFQNNNVNNGSSIYKRGGNLELCDCQFINNTGENGPALNIFNGKTHVINCKFVTNNASEDGGAVCSGDDLKVERSQFLNNKAQKNGGAILLRGKNIIYACTFTANSAYSGGSIQNQCDIVDIGQNNDSECSIIKCIFNSNRGTVGGAINNMGYCSIKESISANNYAYCGGFIDNWGSCIIYCSSITNNSASGGGAIGNIGNMSIHLCILTGNSANCGFTILNEYGCTVNATDNWWGSDSDPKDQIYGEVTYIPVLTSPPNIPLDTKITKQEMPKKLNTTKITDIK